MNWANPENWLDLVAYGWYGLVIIAVAAVPAWFANRNHKSIKAETQVLREQLVNGHKVPMRMDLDKALAAIEMLAHEVRGIRTDLQLEEDRRRRDVAELENQIGRHRKQEA